MTVAVIGCGYWGKNLVRNFAELGVLAAVYDTDSALGTSIADAFGTVCRSLEAILGDSSIQGIVIATPPVHHAAIAEKALKAGKHVLVEKPLALTSGDAESLCALAEKEGCVLMVGHLLQYHPGFLKLQEIVLQGHLGKLQYIHSNRLNFGKFRQHENILWDLAPHDISMILSLTGCMPESVFTTGHCHVNTAIADLTTTYLSFPGAINAHILLSWLHPFKEHKLIAIGEEGMAVFDDGADWDQKVQIYKHRVALTDGTAVSEKADVTYIPLAPAEPLRHECEHFFHCMRDGTMPRTDGQEALNVLKIVEAAEESMKTMRPVELAAPIVSINQTRLQGKF